MWRQIRGQGLAYSYKVVPRPHESLLYFTLYRAGMSSVLIRRLMPSL
jgi:Zn-dependent M16 (insulinase) family peptidase